MYGSFPSQTSLPAKRSIRSNLLRRTYSRSARFTTSEYVLRPDTALASSSVCSCSTRFVRFMCTDYVQVETASTRGVHGIERDICLISRPLFDRFRVSATGLVERGFVEPIERCPIHQQDSDRFASEVRATVCPHIHKNALPGR